MFHSFWCFFLRSRYSFVWFHLCLLLYNLSEDSFLSPALGISTGECVITWTSLTLLNFMTRGILIFPLVIWWQMSWDIQPGSYPVWLQWQAANLQPEKDESKLEWFLWLFLQMTGMLMLVCVLLLQSVSVVPWEQGEMLLSWRWVLIYTFYEI